VRNNEILRLTPRHNPSVNDYWMCDHGRLNTFPSVNDASRVKSPMIRRERELVEVGWDEALSAVAVGLKGYKKYEIAGIASPFATNEDNYLFGRLLSHLGTRKVDFRRYTDPGSADALLVHADKTPNSAGVVEVGAVPDDPTGSFDGILHGIREGTIKAVYVIDEMLATDPAVLEALAKVDFLVVHAGNHNALTALADVVLASATYAEKNGTMVNCDGHVQRIRPAVATLEQERSMDGFSMSRLDRFGAPNDRWMKGPRRDARPTWRICLGVANALGAKWRYATAEEVFTEIASTREFFRGMSYLRIGSKGTAVKKPTVTVSSLKR